MVTLFVLILLGLFDDALGSCGYADLTAELLYSGTSFVVGEFVLSTDKCQALSGNVFGSALIEGALILTCDPSDNSNTNIIVKQYNDPLCLDGSFEEESTVSIGDQITLLHKSIYFTLNDMQCSDRYCGIDITFADNCQASHGVSSSSYTNFGFPMSICQTFGDDFDYGGKWFVSLSQIPYSLLPQASATALFETALKFKCCDDNSLLIYNYSDSSTNCDDESTDYNLLRLKTDYNDTCFALGDDQLPFDTTTNKASTESVNTDNDVFGVRYTWNCDSDDDQDFVDCDSLNIPFLDNEQLPNECPQDCFLITDAPSAAPTFHPVSDNNAVTVQPHNIQNEQPLSGASKGVLIGVIVFLSIVAICIILLCIYRKRKMKKMVDESEKKQIEQRDSKYEPMMNGPALLNPTGPGSGQNDIDEGGDPTTTTSIVTKTSEDDNDGGDYVLPGKVTDGHSIDGQSGLLP